MITAKKTPRPTTRRLGLRAEVAREVLPAIYASAGYEILNQKDGKIAARAVYLSFEVADAFIASITGSKA